MRELLARHHVAATTSFDEAHDVVRQFFLPHRIDLLERESGLDMRLNAVRVGGLTAGYLRYGRDVRLRTEEATHFHINIPVTGANESRCGTMDSVQATPDTAAVFTPGRPADIRWPGDCAQLCLMIDRDEVEAELVRLLGRPLTRPLEFQPRMDLTTTAGRGWFAALSLLTSEYDQPESAFRHPLAARNLEHVVIDGLLLAQPHNYSMLLAAPPRAAGPRAVRRAIELLEGQPEQPWSPARLAASVSVSVRSLHEGFQRAMQMSPMVYLREIRLNRVHDELRVSSRGTVTVTEVAGRWGFVHLGRFASAYRRKFGEAPSDTLSRK
jgi:AraC-like DNA-binding protein